MKRPLKALIGIAYAAFIAFAIALSAGEVYANARADCDGGSQLGSCAGFGTEICSCACQEAMYSSGFCDLDDCCTCLT